MSSGTDPKLHADPAVAVPDDAYPWDPVPGDDVPITLRPVPEVFGVSVTPGLREAVELVDAALLVARTNAPHVQFVDLAGAVRATEGT